MNYIYSGGEFTVYDNSVKSFDKLPAGMYRVNFHPQKGWWLTSDHPIIINEKIYGDHERKAKKAVETFKIFPRNLGVLLSGNKGMGKSLVCKMICKNMVDLGYPVITVDSYIPGISDFLHKIDTESVIFLDEFDKIFHQSEEDYENNSLRPQDEMLSLFDGSDTNKKMFLVTCNQIANISDYFINRPGRFHYHYRFTYPTKEEIEHYLRENVKEEYADEIVNVLAFSKKVKLSYDCLRSIVFELNLGNSFYDFIDDLNILNVQEETYEIKLIDSEHNIYSCVENLNIISEEPQNLYIYCRGKGDILVTFNMNDLDYNEEKHCYIPKDIKDITIEPMESKKNIKIKSFTIKSLNDNMYSYFV